MEIGDVSRAELEAALEDAIKLQGFYANLLNQYDGGLRHVFTDAADWLRRRAETCAAARVEGA